MSPIILPGYLQGGSTYLELQDAVLFNTLGERFRAPAKVWLNDAVRDVCRRLRIQKSACVGTTDANGTLTLAASFWRVSEVYTVASTVAAGAVSLTTVEQFADRRLSPISSASGAVLTASTGTPYSYEAIVTGGAVALRVLPAPAVGTKVAVIGYAFPTAMSVDADTSGLSPDLDEALVSFCRARAFRREDDLQMASMWDQEYITRLRNVLPSVVSHQDGPLVTPGEGYGDPWTGGG
jgi:hypothetical protein